MTRFPSFSNFIDIYHCSSWWLWRQAFCRCHLLCRCCIGVGSPYWFPEIWGLNSSRKLQRVGCFGPLPFGTLYSTHSPVQGPSLVTQSHSWVGLGALSTQKTSSFVSPSPRSPSPLLYHHGRHHSPAKFSFPRLLLHLLLLYFPSPSLLLPLLLSDGKCSGANPVSPIPRSSPHLFWWGMGSVCTVEYMGPPQVEPPTMSQFVWCSLWTLALLLLFLPEGKLPCSPWALGWGFTTPITFTTDCNEYLEDSSWLGIGNVWWLAMAVWMYFVYHLASSLLSVP